MRADDLDAKGMLREYQVAPPLHEDRQRDRQKDRQTADGLDRQIRQTD